MARINLEWKRNYKWILRFDSIEINSLIRWDDEESFHNTKTKPAQSESIKTRLKIKINKTLLPLTLCNSMIEHSDPRSDHPWWDVLQEPEMK